MDIRIGENGMSVTILSPNPEIGQNVMNFDANDCSRRVGYSLGKC